MSDPINIFTLKLKDIDEHDWTLERLRGKPVVLFLLQGPDAQYFDTWVEPLREALGKREIYLQPVLDASIIPKMLWWGVKKMKGSLMRQRRPEGVPRVLIDMEGGFFRKLRCMPGHFNLVLASKDGEVLHLHQIATTEPGAEPKSAMAEVLGHLPA